MEAVFLKLVNMSITASYLVIAVILLRLVLKRAPRWLHASLWGLVGLRLALPFSFESVLSLIPSTEPLPEEFLYAATPQIQTGIPAVNNRLNPIIAQSLTPQGLTSANPTQIWSFILANLWLVGLVAMVIYAMVSYFVIRRRVAAFIPVSKQIRLCDSIDTPFILGIIRSKIYLPSALDEATAAHVLAHEKAHLTRKDHWWKPLGYLLLCIYWFNPILWLAYILLCRDIEMACDEKVIREMAPSDKKAYSNALLSCSVPRRLITACPLAFGEVGVKERIKSVLNYNKPAFWVIVVAVTASIVVAVCFLTDPAINTPYPITSALKKEEVEWAQVTLWEDETQHIELSSKEIQELVDILNALEEDDFVQSKVPEHDVSLMIYCGKKEILLHFDGDYVRFIFDSETAGGIDDEWCYIKNNELNDFISTVCQRQADRLEPDTGADIPVTYPETTIEGQENHLYSTISGQIYDVRTAQDMLIRNAILENNPMSGSVSFESHQILSELLGCGAEVTEGGPVGFTVVDVISVVMNASLNERTIPTSVDNYQIINATITYERYADGTYIRTEYQENETGDLGDYDLTPLYQHCYDQAVKYWGLDANLMVDSLLDTISSSPAKYSNAAPYIEAHREEYDQLVNLGAYTLNYCFDAFLNNRTSGIRADIMAAACRDISKSMGEDIDFEGQYVNGPSWFDTFHANAMALYETNGLDTLEETNPVSWLLLNMIGQIPDPIPSSISAEIVDSEHHTNAVSLHVDVKFPESIDVGAIEEIPTPESVILDYTSERGDQHINTTSSTVDSVDAQSNSIRYHFIFELYEREPVDSRFVLNMSGLPEADPNESLVIVWTADVDEARTFAAKSGDSDVTLTISPYLINVEFSYPDYNSISDLRNSIQIWDIDGRLLPIRGTYGGMESKYRMSLSVTLLEPLDIDAIKTVKVGGLILE